MTIRNITLIVSILLFLLSCNQKKNASSDVSQNNKLDSTIAQRLESSVDEVEPSEKEVFQQTYGKLVQSYNKSEIIDSTFIIETDSFRVKIEYCCLKNSNVVVPVNFLVPNMNKDLLTHDFVLKLTILKNNKPYFKRMYEKKYFYNQLHINDVKKYGVIFSPYIECVEDNLILSASISIPLTELGEAVGDTLNMPRLRK